MAITRLQDLERYDKIHSEAVHANYTMQVAQRQTDALTSTRVSIASVLFDISGLLSQTMVFLMGAWLALQNDCSQLASWIQAEGPVSDIFPFALLSAHIQERTSLHV